MIVIWSPKAKESLKKVARYIFLSFGKKPTEKFMKQIFHVEKILSSNPNIGSIDPLLINHSKPYRSIVVNNLNKLVYFVEADVVHIAAFWDTRREPKNLIKDLEKTED